MHVQLTQRIDDITGVTGTQSIEAILAGQRWKSLTSSGDSLHNCLRTGVSWRYGSARVLRPSTSMIAQNCTSSIRASAASCSGRTRAFPRSSHPRPHLHAAVPHRQPEGRVPSHPT